MTARKSFVEDQTIRLKCQALIDLTMLNWRVPRSYLELGKQDSLDPQALP